MAALDSNAITAIATASYGLATFLLVIQLWRDRVQREKHFERAEETRRVNDLRRAFYEAWGYWEGRGGTTSAPIDASQLGRILEALIRLECELRLNHHTAEADDLGFAIRRDFVHSDTQLNKVGIALGLLPTGYRR